MQILYNKQKLQSLQGVVMARSAVVDACICYIIIIIVWLLKVRRRHGELVQEEDLSHGVHVCLTFLFFLTEIIFGYVTNSLALIGDSYHMLSDVMALIVGLTALRVEIVLTYYLLFCHFFITLKLVETRHTRLQTG